MTRVAIIGNAGGGNTQRVPALSRKLAQARALPVYAVDQMAWQPGWVPMPPDTFARQHDALLQQERWIIDGWGPWDAITKRFRHADTIILIDYPLWVHYWWSIKRQFKCLFRPRPDGPPGCPMLPMTGALLRMVWQIYHRQRPQLLHLVASFSDHKQVVHLRSSRELRQFVQSCC